MKRVDGFVITYYYNFLAEDGKDKFLLFAKPVIIPSVSGAPIFALYKHREINFFTNLNQLYWDTAKCLDLLCKDATGRDSFILTLSSLLQLNTLSQLIIVSTNDRNLQAFIDKIMFRRKSELNNPS